MKRILAYLFILFALTLGLQATSVKDANAADCWVYNNETTNWFVMDETIWWREDGLYCEAQIKTASRNVYNTAKTKIHYEKFFYDNGIWYVKPERGNPVSVDDSPSAQAVLNFLFKYR